MQIRYIISITFFLLSYFNVTYGQKKFKVIEKETGTWLMIFEFINENGAVIQKLDTNSYVSINFNDEKYGYFAIFKMIDSLGWHAIDADEKILFKVYNTSIGEPSPDYLVENKIRVVDEKERIGFANEKGEIIIKPCYEAATSFHNGKAIIGGVVKKFLGTPHTLKVVVIIIQLCVLKTDT